MLLLDRANNDWWYVKNPKGLQGYVPRNFVALQKSVESEKWYAGRIPRFIFSTINSYYILEK